MSVVSVLRMVIVWMIVGVVLGGAMLALLCMGDTSFVCLGLCVGSDLVSYDRGAEAVLVGSGGSGEDVG